MSETGLEYLRGPAKRRLDVVCSLGVLGLGVVPFAAGIGAASITSGTGRPFFTQERDDYADGTFTIHKLRSLNDRKVADSAPADYGTFDPRTGRLGNVLRASGIDEFPQLYDVLRGPMSFVGPRPLPESVLDVWHDADPILFDDWRAASRGVRPGIVSPGTLVRKRDDPRDGALFARSMRADLEYVERASIRTDLRIIGRAACHGFGMAGRIIRSKLLI